jgi:hypothetical protein
MDPRKHGFMYSELTKVAQSFTDVKLMGQDPTEQATFDHQKCYKKFTNMWSLCGNHKGQPVTLYCRLKVGGPIVTINNAGCHCPKIARQMFEGHMIETPRMDPCIDYYLQWAAEAKSKFMATSTLRACSMQLERRCQKQRVNGRENAIKAVEKQDSINADKSRPFNKLISAYDKRLNHAQKTLQTLHYTLAHPTYRFHRIPGMAVTGDEVAAQSMASCKTSCNLQGTCKSFSYNTLTNKCFVSLNTLQFDPDWTMYLKGKDPQLGNDFFTIPGMKALDAEEADQDAEKTSFGECKFECYKNADCTGFSYNQVTRTCMGAGSVIYDPNFSYYEKTGVLEGGGNQAVFEMQERLSNENAEKEAIKKQWETIVELRNGEAKPTRKAELGDSQASRAGGWHTMKVRGVVQP